MLKKLVISFSILAAVVGCSGDLQGEASYPKSREEQEWERVGKLTGDEGLVIAGGKKKSSATTGINVNSYLWRASLDVVHKMPLLSADPFGGTILTDWYRNTQDAKERYKLNVFIIGAELRSDAVRVAVFKQKLDSRGNWLDVEASPELATQIEDKILLAARNMKFSGAK